MTRPDCPVSSLHSRTFLELSFLFLFFLTYYEEGRKYRLEAPEIGGRHDSSEVSGGFPKAPRSADRANKREDKPQNIFCILLIAHHLNLSRILQICKMFNICVSSRQYHILEPHSSRMYARAYVKVLKQSNVDKYAPSEAF